jgi:hypothetical protein
MKILIHKNDESGDDEHANKMIRFEEIKVSVTPNGPRFKKSIEFGDADGEYVDKINSDNTIAYNKFLGKSTNFDLEQEVDYTPNAKLILPSYQK